MLETTWVEWIGYAASIAIVCSLLMSSIVKLRVINMVGALLFVWYGFLVKAYPVVISNVLIICINLYYLYQLDLEQDKNK